MRLSTITTTAASSTGVVGLWPTIAVLLIVVTPNNHYFRNVYIANAYSTGAGGCAAGMAAVGGGHLANPNLSTGNLLDGGIQVFIDGTDPVAVAAASTGPDDAGILTVPVGEDFEVMVRAVAQASFFRGILIMSGDASVSSMTPTDPTTLQVAAACTAMGNIGVTHVNPETKNQAVVSVTCDAPGLMTIDITVVRSNNANQGSVYYYSGYTLECVEDDGEDSAGGATPPVASPVAAAAAPVTAMEEPPVVVVVEPTATPSVSDMDMMEASEMPTVSATSGDTEEDTPEDTVDDVSVTLVPTSATTGSDSEIDIDGDDDNMLMANETDDMLMTNETNFPTLDGDEITSPSPAVINGGSSSGDEPVLVVPAPTETDISIPVPPDVAAEANSSESAAEVEYMMMFMKTTSTTGLWKSAMGIVVVATTTFCMMMM